MTKRPHPPSAAQTRRAWGPTWAKVAAWVVLVPAALAMFFGVAFFIQGFGDEALAAVGFLVGPVLILLALAIAVPAVLFLVFGGKTRFVIALCTTGLFLLILTFYGF